MCCTPMPADLRMYDRDRMRALITGEPGDDLLEE
jgi:hypothetical protein